MKKYLDWCERAGSCLDPESISVLNVHRLLTVDQSSSANTFFKRAARIAHQLSPVVRHAISIKRRAYKRLANKNEISRNFGGNFRLKKPSDSFVCCNDRVFPTVSFATKLASFVFTRLANFFFPFFRSSSDRSKNWKMKIEKIVEMKKIVSFRDILRTRKVSIGKKIRELNAQSPAERDAKIKRNRADCNTIVSSIIPAKAARYVSSY